ncbi:peptidoglycan editing factor PgeF [Myxococcota bacterium]|nr:peptidoglycan editing factor PgeF [Myxococcota bacterium]
MTEIQTISAPVLNLPGVAHCFTTRLGGNSAPPYHHANMHFRKGGNQADVFANRELVLKALDLPPGSLRLVDQVHGSRVVLANGLSLAETEVMEADGLVTTHRGTTVAVYVADCLPLLLYAPGGVAALHGGWRSVIAGILQEGIALLGEQTGANPRDFHLAIGPGIGPCCFEVGPEVTLQFRDQNLEEHILSLPGKEKEHIDLPGAVKSLALRAGLMPTNIWSSNLCTMCRDDLFYSYRRQGWPTGQMMGIIGLN